MQIKWNHKIVLLAVIMILSAASVFTGRISRAAVDSGEAPLVILYDQNNNPAGSSTGSQEFPDFPTFTDFAADDFVVPGGQTWTISEVDATGVYFNGPGPADNFNVFIYQNSGTLPGTQVYSATAQPFTNTSGLFAITLTAPAVLPAGTYWVSVQSHQNSTTNGQWGWTDRTVQSNSPAAWQNPGGGFMVCPTWGVRGVCVGNPASPDQLFRLQGTIAGVGTPTPTPTLTPGITPTPTASPCTGNYNVNQIGGSIVPGTTDIGNHGDDTVTTVALPFQYCLYGQCFTSVNLSSNGNAQFTTTDTTFTNQCLPWPAHDYTIYAYWDDLYLVNSGFGIFTSVSGTAPNRIFNIEWRAQYFPGSGTANLELRLYEGQNRFDVIYGTVTNGNTGATAGAQKNDSLVVQYFCDGAGGAATGGQSYILGTCGTPTPTPPVTPSPTRTPTPTPPVSPTPTPVASPSCSPAAWTQGPAQPPARYAIQGALGTDNMLYIAGGQNADTVPIFYNQVSRYNYTNNTWTNVAALPVALSQATTAAANGKVYVAGGWTGGSTALNSLWIYDIATNTWSAGPNMPAANGVEAAAGAIVNGKFYVMGGDDVTNGLNTNYIYTIATNAWSTGAPLPDNRTNTYGTAASNGMIYVYGGVILPAFTTVDTLLRYDPVANTWANLGSAGTGGRGNYGGISPFGTGQLFITDGALNTGVSSTATHIFTISSGTFSAGPAMIGNRAGHAQGTLPDGRVIVVDGFNTATTVTSTVELLGASCPSASPSPSPTPPQQTPTPTRTPTPTPTTSPTINPSPSPSCTPGGYTVMTTTGTITAGGTDIGNHCDDCGTAVNLPFPVTVYGTATSVATVGSNGDIQLTSTPSTKVFWWAGCVPIDPDPTSQGPFLRTLFPYYDDLRTDANPMQACADCGIFTQTLGTAPNRQFVIRYKTTYFNHAGTAEFQVLLTEGSGTLSVIYGPSNNNGLEATSGLQRDLSVFTSFSCMQATLTPGLRVNYIPAGCPTGSPSPTPPVTPTPPRTPTPTPSMSPTPGVTPTPGLRFCNGAPIDMNLNAPAVPYPSTITVAGAPSITGGVIVTLNGLWHQFPDNIDILLVGPRGQKYVLMGDAGGPIPIPQTAPVTLTLRDFVPTVLPNNGPLVTGTYIPTNWETPVLSFAAPAPPAPYVEPGNQPFPPIGRTLFGSFGLLNPNGVWSLYVRDDGGNPVDPEILIGQISGGWCIEFLPPTAAGVSISGRVQTASGAGIRNARVVVSGNALPEPREVTTGSFGYFSVDGLIAGETYVVTANSQRYTFQMPSRVYNLVDNITDADFVADQE